MNDILFIALVNTLILTSNVSTEINNQFLNLFRVKGVFKNHEISFKQAYFVLRASFDYGIICDSNDVF